MDFVKKGAELFVPDELRPDLALPRITHLAIGAHQDDIEIMAYHGILECFESDSKYFAGITCCDGAGSPRTGAYAKYSDEEMQQIRRREQRQAALVGRYAAMVQLNYTSGELKDPQNTEVVADLVKILQAASPSVVYTHNPADKHDTHLGVVVAAIRALRALPAGSRPEKVFGCEVWRGLDWLADQDKRALDVSRHENMALALLGIYDSQIAGGKRYDLATMGRRRANASYFQSHGLDEASHLSFAVDLTPLIEDPDLDLVEYISILIDRFKMDVRARLQSRLGKV